MSMGIQDATAVNFAIKEWNYLEQRCITFILTLKLGHSSKRIFLGQKMVRSKKYAKIRVEIELPVIFQVLKLNCIKQVILHRYLMFYNKLEIVKGEIGK